MTIVTEHRFGKHPTGTITHMDDPVGQHLEWCAQRNLRPLTIRARRLTLARLERDVGPLIDVTTTQIEAWWHTKSVLRPNTRAVELANVSAFYRWAQLARLRDDNPCDLLPRPRHTPSLPRPIGEAELARALEHADPHIADWLILAAYAGLRACEIALVCGEHLDHELRTLIVPEGKGGYARTLPAHDRILERAKVWPERGPVWAPRSVNANVVCKYSNEYLRAIGARATLHKLRARFGTRAYHVSRDVMATRDLLGHRSLSSTLAYVALVDPGGRQIVDQL